MRTDPSPVEICILAGGASSRMGKDKARVRVWKQRTMLSIIREQAEGVSGATVRVIRRDLVPKCGPLGGVYTALKTTKASSVLFLACDMPLITTGLLQKLLARISDETEALFMLSESAGFPFVLRTTALSMVEEQIARKEFSLHRLCQRMKGKVIEPSEAEARQLANINTVEELDQLRIEWIQHANSPFRA
ncbi:MAG: molybdenum cofactor guanylyltransferase [Limisphaerales bacterium]